MAGFSVRKKGPWKQARQKLTKAQRVREKLLRALRRAVLLVEREIKLGLTGGAPNGQPFRPLAPLTVFLRRQNSDKPLLDNGDLLGSVNTQVDEASLTGFAGVFRQGAGASGVDRARIAEIHEFGTDPYVIPVTDAMRRFFLAISLKSGGRFRPLRADTTVLTHPGVPARPFLRPALEAARPKIAKVVRAELGEG